MGYILERRSTRWTSAPLIDRALMGNVYPFEIDSSIVVDVTILMPWFEPIVTRPRNVRQSHQNMHEYAPLLPTVA